MNANIKINLNRFGDTSFRIKKQINFYTEILQIINDNNNNNITIDDIWNKINGDIFNYNETDRKVSHKNLLAKQLINFNLVEKTNQNNLKTTKLGKKFIDIINSNNKINVSSILWFYLMINCDKNISKIFKEFCSSIIDEKEEIGLYINNFIFSSESYNDRTLEEYIDIKLKNKMKDNWLNIILSKNSIKSGISSNKKLNIDNSIPKLVNLIKSDDKYESKKLIENDEKLYENLKKIYKYKKNAILKNYNELENFIFNEKEKLIIYSVECAYIRTIEKDYYDINKRWFIDCQLLIERDKKLYINESNRELYKSILSLPFDDDLINIFDFLKKYDVTDRKIILPYNKEDILCMLKLANENKWISLKEKYKLEEISNATIFEYLINMSFILWLEKDHSSFYKYSRTLLDYNLKPMSHAPGRGSDGIMDIDGFNFTIESTIIDEVESIIRNEKTSIQRHCYNYFNNIENNQIPTCIFILKRKLDNVLIWNFSSDYQSKYFMDPNINMNIVLLSCDMFIELLEKNKIVEIAELCKMIKISSDDNFENIEKKYNSFW